MTEAVVWHGPRSATSHCSKRKDALVAQFVATFVSRSLMGNGECALLSDATLHVRVLWQMHFVYRHGRRQPAIPTQGRTEGTAAERRCSGCFCCWHVVDASSKDEWCGASAPSSDCQSSSGILRHPHVDGAGPAAALLEVPPAVANGLFDSRRQHWIVRSRVRRSEVRR
jgi:hypothetical protein